MFVGDIPVVSRSGVDCPTKVGVSTSKVLTFDNTISAPSNTTSRHYFFLLFNIDYQCEGAAEVMVRTASHPVPDQPHTQQTPDRKASPR